MTLNTRVRNFLSAIAGLRDIPDPESPYETILSKIAERLNKQLLPVPQDGDIGKVPVVKADKSYEFSDAPFELPEITAADNGKTMVARDGHWNLDMPDNQVLTVTFTYSSGLYSCDKDYGTIYAAKEKGYLILFKFDNVAAPATWTQAQGGNYFKANVIVEHTDSNNILTYWVYSLFSVSGIGPSGSVRVMQRGFMPQSVEDTAPSISVRDYIEYQCGELTRLTITNNLSIGPYIIWFDSGSGPTVTILPATIKGLENFSAEANTRYRIYVEKNCATIDKWTLAVENNT